MSDTKPELTEEQLRVLKETMGERKTVNDIVDMMVDHAHDIIRWKIIAAKHPGLGTPEEAVAVGLPEEWYNYDHRTLDEIVAIVTPMLKSAQQTRQVTANSSKDIIGLLKQGKISITDGIELLKLMNMKLTVSQKEVKVKAEEQLTKIFEGDTNEHNQEQPECAGDRSTSSTESGDQS